MTRRPIAVLAALGVLAVSSAGAVVVLLRLAGDGAGGDGARAGPPWAALPAVAALALLSAAVGWAAARWAGGPAEPEEPYDEPGEDRPAATAQERARGVLTWPFAPVNRWTEQRLREALQQGLPGESIVLCANREPYVHERARDGSVRIRHPVSGLVTALEPVMRACSGTWIAHGSGSADAETVDEHDRVLVPPGEESYTLRRLWLTPEEEQGYYYGFANEGLWPLCHLAHTAPIFRASDWRHYLDVNERFAAAVSEEARGERPIVLVQDYHFAVTPRRIRERLPGATVLSFWHIPWPNAENFGICPWREELLVGLLGSSILGFHTQLHVNNFLDAVDRYIESRIDREDSAVVYRGHRTLVRVYPISIEWPHEGTRDAPSPAECRKRVLAELELPRDAIIGVGVDRVDYTKGIEERFLAVEQLLADQPGFIGRFCFVQLAAPSRTAIPAYKELGARLEETADRINERFGIGRWKPIHLLREHHESETVIRYYRAAAVCYVSSLHDGMNLVAKEFVAARDDLGGVLMLSQFTGAARELREALVVNPYDLEEASRMLARALTMSLSEQRRRMRSMRAHLSEFNVYRWAGQLIEDAARVREQSRLEERNAPGRVQLEAREPHVGAG